MGFNSSPSGYPTLIHNKTDLPSSLPQSVPLPVNAMALRGVDFIKKNIRLWYWNRTLKNGKMILVVFEGKRFV